MGFLAKDMMMRQKIGVLATFLGLLMMGTFVSATPSLRDIEYGPDPRHRLDVYMPRQPRNAPVVVMVHGGGWRFGDKSNPNVWQNKVAHWTRQGTIVVAVNYRLVPQVAPLDQAKHTKNPTNAIKNDLHNSHFICYINI